MTVYLANADVVATAGPRLDQTPTDRWEDTTTTVGRRMDERWGAGVLQSALLAIFVHSNTIIPFNQSYSISI